MKDMARVRYWAGARALARTAEQYVAGDTLEAVLAEVKREHGAPMTRLLGISVLLVDGVQVDAGQPDLPVGPDAVVEILPPYAGGAR
jgi:molybdopterin converting factor small subunit